MYLVKTAAHILFVLAGLTTLVAIKNVFLGGENRPQEIENMVGYAVGAFLLPVAFLIIGLVLLNKVKDRSPDEDA